MRGASVTALRLLNPQGIAGLAVSIVLALLLVTAKVDARHWRKQSAQFEMLFRDEARANAATTANVRAATEQARQTDAANAERVAVAQAQINERTVNQLEDRLADARARAQRLRLQSQAAADFRRGGSAAMPRLPAAAAGAVEGPREDRLSDSDALTATLQAIQLDELIRWVRAQSAVEVEGTVRKR